MTENVIEWIKDQQRATLTLSQRRTITKVKCPPRNATPAIIFYSIFDKWVIA